MEASPVELLRLSARVSALERHNRRLRLLLLLAGGFAGTLAVAAAARPQERTLEVHRLVLDDSDGHGRAEVTFSARGGLVVVIHPAPDSTRSSPSGVGGPSTVPGRTEHGALRFTQEQGLLVLGRGGEVLARLGAMAAHRPAGPTGGLREPRGPPLTRP
jgi:hypothetical protein